MIRLLQSLNRLDGIEFVKKKKWIEHNNIMSLAFFFIIYVLLNIAKEVLEKQKKVYEVINA